MGHFRKCQKSTYRRLVFFFNDMKYCKIYQRGMDRNREWEKETSPDFSDRWARQQSNESSVLSST